MPRSKRRGEAWLQQPKETTARFHAFCHYRDLPMWDRTIFHAWEEHQRDCLGKTDYKPSSRRHWEAWSSENKWIARVDDYEAHLAEIRRLRRLDQLMQAHTKHEAVASGIIGRVATALKEISNEDLARTDVRSLAQALKMATDVQLRALGYQAKTELAVTDGKGGPVRLVIEYAAGTPPPGLTEDGVDISDVIDVGIPQLPPGEIVVETAPVSG